MAHRLQTHATRSPRPRGFTLTEILVAVAVLVALLLAASRIFSTTQQVTSAGEANAIVLAEIAAIERQFREDLEHLSYDGYFAVRNVALRNLQRSGSLLNPSLPPDAVIRADQLLFFREGLEQPQVHRIGAREKIRPRGTISRVIWSHGISGYGAAAGQVGEWRTIDVPIFAENGDLVTPWVAFSQPWDTEDPVLVDPLCTQTEQIGGAAGSGMFEQEEACLPLLDILSRITAPRREARDWPLVRQAAVLLSDDPAGAPVAGFSRTVYQSDSFGDTGGVNTARSIFLVDPHPDFGGEVLPELRNSRVDAAGVLLDDIHRRLAFVDPENPLDTSDANIRPWRRLADLSDPPQLELGLDDRYSYLANPGFGALYWPRAERVPGSPHRTDQAQTVPIIGTAVSSIRIEWTWDEGTGEAFNEIGRRYLGVSYRDDSLFDPLEPNEDWTIQPSLAGDRIWFGLPDDWDRPTVAPYAYGRRPATGTGITVVNDPTINANALLGGAPRWTRTGTIDWRNVESFDPAGLLAFRDDLDSANLATSQISYMAAFGRNRGRLLDRSFVPSQPISELAYTPWPSAIRVTLVVHDPATVLEQGREVQFVIELPKERDRRVPTGIAGDVRQDPAFLSGASIILQDD